MQCRHHLPSAQLTPGPCLPPSASLLLAIRDTCLQVYAIGVDMYFRSYWNTLDTLSAWLVLAICPMHIIRVSNEEGGALAPMIAFGMILVSHRPAALPACTGAIDRGLAGRERGLGRCGAGISGHARAGRWGEARRALEI